jgi:hypothetical protein
MKKFTLRKWIIFGFLFAILIAGSSISIVYLRDYIVDKKYEFKPEDYVWDFNNMVLFSSQIEERSEHILYFMGQAYTISNETYYIPNTNETITQIEIRLLHLFYGDKYSYAIWHDSKKNEWQYRLNILGPTSREKPDFVSHSNAFSTLISALAEDLVQTQNWHNATGDIPVNNVMNRTVLGLSYYINFIFDEGSNFEFCSQNNEIKFYYRHCRDYYVQLDGSSGWFPDFSIPHVAFRGNFTGLFPQHTNAINDLIKQHSS